jgi:hypothetical protein
MNTNISNTDDVIDSRQVIERIEELTELRDAVKEVEEELAEAKAEGDANNIVDAEQRLESALADFTEVEKYELEALEALQEEAEGYSEDWKYGATLIRDSYFTTYAQELAEDIGAVSKDMQWPLLYIDWEKATEELQMDYTSVDFDGVTYWVR